MSQFGSPGHVQLLEGMHSAVHVSRGALGIPRVEAGNLDDLFFGQGFATAQDRLWQMEWDRRRAMGRSAELVGSPSNVVTDSFYRRVRLVDSARAGYLAFDQETRAMCDAYCAGINAYVASNSERPIEFRFLDCPDEPWAGWHSVAVFLVRHITFATWQTKLWNARVFAALGPEAVPAFRIEGSIGDTPLIVPPGGRAAVGLLTAAGLFGGALETLSELEPLGLQLSGSNAWAVDGSLTASGGPLVAGDPHRAFETPNVYYQVRLVCPEFDAAGFTFPGVPGIQHFGQTDHVAWAVTNAGSDYQDLFVEHLPGAAIDTRVETVEVRDGSPIEVECTLTTHGPIVLGDSARKVGVALASTGLIEAGGSFSSILGLLRSRTVADLDTALISWVEPANNFVMADSTGSIAYRTAGRIPIRAPLNSVLPVPGWDASFDWTGHIPDADLPRSVNPDTHAIVTANQRITTRDYPHLLNYDAAPPYRAERIWARLSEHDDHNVESMAAVHRDTVSIPALHLATLVVDAGCPPDVDRLLRRWDGKTDASSAAALVVGLIHYELCALITQQLPDELKRNPFATWEPPSTAYPAQLRVANAVSGWLANDDTTVIGRSPWQPLIAEATKRALTGLRAKHGADVSNWRWGDVHQAAPSHPLRGLDSDLDRLIQPHSGALSGAADCVMATNQVGGLTTHAMSGSTARYVWDLADRRRSKWCVPLGSSGDPSSPHFRDQTSAWATGELFPVDNVD